jgi:hypothetical protein
MNIINMLLKSAGLAALLGGGAPISPATHAATARH